MAITPARCAGSIGVRSVRPFSASPSIARVVSRSDCRKIASMPTSSSSSMPAVQAASAGSDGRPSS